MEVRIYLLGVCTLLPPCSPGSRSGLPDLHRHFSLLSHSAAPGHYSYFLGAETRAVPLSYALSPTHVISKASLRLA